MICNLVAQQQQAYSICCGTCTAGQLESWDNTSLSYKYEAMPHKHGVIPDSSSAANMGQYLTTMGYYPTAAQLQ